MTVGRRQNDAISLSTNTGDNTRRALSHMTIRVAIHLHAEACAIVAKGRLLAFAIISMLEKDEVLNSFCWHEVW